MEQGLGVQRAETYPVAELFLFGLAKGDIVVVCALKSQSRTSLRCCSYLPWQGGYCGGVCFKVAKSYFFAELVCFPWQGGGCGGV